MSLSPIIVLHHLFIMCKNQPLYYYNFCRQPGPVSYHGDDLSKEGYILRSKSWENEEERNTKSQGMNLFLKSEFKHKRHISGSNTEMPPTNCQGIHQPANTGDELVTHRHHSTLRGQRRGSNPSAEPHDLLLGRTVSYYYKSKDELGGGRAGSSNLSSLVVTSKTVNFPSAIW